MHRHRQSSACASPLSRRARLERLSPPPPHTSSPPPRPPLTSSIPPLHVPPPPPRPPCLSSPNQLACSSSSGAGVRRLVRPRIPVERTEGSVHLGRHGACVALRITSGTAQGRPRSAPYRTGSPSRRCEQFEVRAVFVIQYMSTHRAFSYFSTEAITSIVICSLDQGLPKGGELAHGLPHHLNHASSPLPSPPCPPPSGPQSGRQQ